MYWHDPRVTPSTTLSDSTIWVPQLEFKNVLAPLTEVVAHTYSLNSDIAAWIDADLLGNTANQTYVEYDARWSGTFQSPLDLHHFPFDKQTVRINFESACCDITQVVFQPASADFVETMLADDLQVTEWTIIGRGVEVVPNYYSNYVATYSSMNVMVQLERQPDFYMFKIVAGSILLVYMGLAVFVIEVHEPDRMNGCIAVFLALIAFVFATAADMPAIAYQTRIDWFMAFSFFLIFLTMFAHAFIYLWRWEDHEEEKIRRHHYKPKPEDYQRCCAALRNWADANPMYRRFDLATVVVLAVGYGIGVGLILHVI